MTTLDDDAARYYLRRWAILGAAWLALTITLTAWTASRTHTIRQHATTAAETVTAAPTAEVTAAPPPASACWATLRLTPAGLADVDASTCVVPDAARTADCAAVRAALHAATTAQCVVYIRGQGIVSGDGTVDPPGRERIAVIQPNQPGSCVPLAYTAAECLFYGS